jgi:progressive ankylosis protein
MMLEGPVLQGAIGRLPQTDDNLAAWGLTMSLSLIIESPVIMLLATAIALVRDGDSYRALRQFTLVLCAICSLLAAAIAFTPLLDVVAGHLMGQPQTLVAAARPALQIMIFWTAAIAWRRFLQGILIRNDAGKRVTSGTAFRLLSIAAVAIGLTLWGHLPGVQVAAWGIMAGVVVEAIATTLFARSVLHEKVLLHPPTGENLTLRDIWRFHAPLAATTLLMLLAQPMTQAALARQPASETTLPAWPVVYMILLILRGFGLALQEITVAEMKRSEGELPLLARFTAIVGIATTSVAAILALTPLLDMYLGGVLHLKPHLWQTVRNGVLTGATLPLVTALGSYTRGILVARGATNLVYRGMLVSIVTQTTLLGAGVLLHFPGMETATIALSVATLAEYLFLRRYAAPVPQPSERVSAGVPSAEA